MAQIVKRKNSYLIRVSCGYSADGTTQKTQSMTWKPPRDNMTDKQIERALNKAALEFEEACRRGQTVNAEKFQVFCEKWFDNYAQRALKQSAIDRCRQYCPRVYEQLGHLRLDRITPYEIDNFILWLTKEKIRTESEAVIKINLSAELKQRELTQSAFAALAGIGQNTVRQAREGKPIKEATAEKIAAALNRPFGKVFEKRKTDKLLSAKTIKNYVSFVSSVFDYAIRIKAINENPCRNAVLPKVRQAEHKMFSIEQAKAFLDILEKPETPVKYRALFELLIFGGFRRGEALGLEWSDIDFETGVIHIKRTVHYSKELGYYDTEPKSKRSVRALTLPDNVIFSIKQLRNAQNSQRLKIGDKWHSTRRLFTTWNGRQMNGASPSKWLADTCAKYDLPKVNLHSFRHLNASLLISNGVDVKTVQSVLGHSQASTTLDIYAAAFQDREARALGVVADILTDGKQRKAE